MHVMLMARCGVLWPWILLVCLPLRSPFNQLVPISTFMIRAKTSHATDLFVFDLDGSVWLAHQTVP